MKKRVGCLYRVSTKGQVDKDDIPMQKKCCHDFVEQNNWEIVKELSEKGVSGFKKSAADRDAIIELRAAAANSEIDVLLVYMFDRIGRKEDETPFVVEWFIRNGIEVWSVMEGQQRIDSHADKLMNYIRYWQASEESIKTSIRTKTRLGQIVLEGHFRGGIAPYGYSLVKRGRTGKKNRELYEIERNDEEAAAVRLIFDIAEKYGYGARKIASEITEMGIRNREGKPFHFNTIRGMLKNVAYIGVLRSGDSVSDVFPELAIIEKEQYERVQLLVKGRSLQHEKHLAAPRKVIGSALLCGNVYCGHCGGRLSASSHRRTRGSDERVFVYRCYDRAEKLNDCDGATTYRAHKVDAVIKELVCDIFDRSQSFDEDSFVKQKVDTELNSVKKLLGKARKDLGGKELELRKLHSYVVDAIGGKGPMSLSRLETTMSILEEEIAELQGQVALLEEKESETEAMVAEIRQEYRKLQGWAASFHDAPAEVQKMIVSQMIERVTISRNYELDIQLAMNLEQFMEGI